MNPRILGPLCLAFVLLATGSAMGQRKPSPAKVQKAIDRLLGSDKYQIHLVSFVTFHTNSVKLPSAAFVRFKVFTDRDLASKTMMKAYENEIYLQVIGKFKDAKGTKEKVEQAIAEVEKDLQQVNMAPFSAGFLIDRKKHYTGLKHWLPPNVARTVADVNQKVSLAVGKANIASYISKAKSGSNQFGWDLMEDKVKVMNDLVDK